MNPVREKQGYNRKRFCCVLFTATMVKILLLIFLFVPGFLFSCETETAANSQTGKQIESTYFINSQEDFDKWSNFEFPAGSKVLFAAGNTFKGQFKLRGSGTAASPNLVGAYDKKTDAIFTTWTDNKPVVHGGGRVGSALELSNGAFWEISNMEVTNTNGTKGDQGNLLGVKVTATDVGVVRDITIKNCYVHDVNGDVGGKETGGIHIYVLGNSIKTRYHNLVIENNRILHVAGVGIANQSSWGSINDAGYFPWTGLAIRNNRVEQTGRNGIIVRYARNPVVEYNIVAYSSRFDTGHSIFNFNTIDCVVQYNEVYGNTSNNPDDIDHGGFDADYNSRGTIIQYNYSHDNNWFCGIMRRAYNTDITIRYNISRNERLGIFLYGFPTEEGVKDVKVYNNTFYFGKGSGKQVFVEAGKTRIPIETSFWNNIFCFEEKANWGFEPGQTCVIENNLYYNVSAKGTNAVVADPLFVDPGEGGTNIDMKDPNRLSGYKLKSGSPAINSGKIVEGDGGVDFSGNPVAGKPDLGAFESGESAI
jgi:hypothetical protein